MITVKQLKELLDDLPDDAMVWAHEGFDNGIAIQKNDAYWFINADERTEVEDSQPYFED